MSETARRALFLTIGQSPRSDILSEMRPWWDSASTPLAIEEAGALDDLDEAAIASLAPERGQPRLVSRLANGTEVQLDATEIESRIAKIAETRSRGRRAPDFIVVLCTGSFPPMDVRRPLLLAQKVVDHSVAAFAETAATIGVLVPHEGQMEELARRSTNGLAWVASHASPYSGARLERAAEELSGTDLVVMHCMGYDEEMRRRVAAVTRKPVLLARRLVATAVAQLL